MKILCLYKPNGEEFRLRGFGNVLNQCGHEFVFWEPKQKSAHDAFFEFKPDIFIGTTFDLSRALIDCIYRYPNTQVILKGGNFGPSNDEIDSTKYPIVKVSQQEKDILGRMKQETGKPNYIFCHYHPNRLATTMSGWDSIGIKSVGLPNAADLFEYLNGQSVDNLLCDVGFVGGYWGYKSEMLNPTIVKLCHPVGKYNIKIFGNQKWPVPQYLGVASTPTVNNLFASAKICPNVSEPHSTVFGFDVIERIFKIISSGGFCLSDRVASCMEDMFNETELATYADNQDFHIQIDYYLNNPEVRKEYIKRGQKRVFAEHTYFDRTRDMLLALDRKDEAALVMEKKCSLLS